MTFNDIIKKKFRKKRIYISIFSKRNIDGKE